MTYLCFSCQQNLFYHWFIWAAPLSRLTNINLTKLVSKWTVERCCWNNYTALQRYATNNKALVLTEVKFKTTKIRPLAQIGLFVLDPECRFKNRKIIITYSLLRSFLVSHIGRLMVENVWRGWEVGIRTRHYFTVRQFWRCYGGLWGRRGWGSERAKCQIAGLTYRSIIANDKEK